MEMERWRERERERAAGEGGLGGGGQGRQGEGGVVIGQRRAAALDGAKKTVLINHADLGFCEFPCA